MENVKRYDMFGLNISMPYKQAVIPYLDQLTKSAQLIGAVNTIIPREGQLIGHNTDGIGFFKSLDKLAGFQVQGKVMTVLGGGGAATAIIAQAALDGAAKIFVFSRSQSIERHTATAQKISKETQVPIEVLPLEDSSLLQEKIFQSRLLVNGTSVGMDGKSLVVDEETILPQNLLVVDVIYQPFETPFINFAKQQGATTVNGLGMLLFQAAEAFQIWTGKEMPTDYIWEKLVQKYQLDKK